MAGLLMGGCMPDWIMCYDVLGCPERTCNAECVGVKVAACVGCCGVLCSPWGWCALRAWLDI